MPAPSRTWSKLAPAKRVSAKPATAISTSGTSVRNEPPSRTTARATRAPTAALSPSGKEAGQLAAPQPAEVDAELMRLGAGKHLVDRQLPLEGPLVDPALLVDALALDHRDLRRRPAPGKAPQT
jgi:hypothetical protein